MSHAHRKIAQSSVQVENPRVIVTEWEFEPGAETTWHCHEFDYIVVPLTTGNLCIKSESGQTFSALRAGESYARSKGVAHNVINQNDFVFKFIEIELKG